MKKTLLFAFALSIGLANVATAQGDYTLSRDWKTNTTANGVDARQGAYANGKFYIQNRPAGEIEIWDQTGKVGSLPSTDKSTGICSDDAGNIIVTNVTAFDWGKESGTTRPVRIYPNGAAPATDIDLIMGCPPPGSLSSDMRCDYFGHVQGNVMSDEGGVFVWNVNRRKYLNVMEVKNGVQDDDKTLAIINENCFYNPVEGLHSQIPGMSAMTAVPAFKFGDQYCMDCRFVGLKGVKVSTNDEGNLVADIENNYTTGQSIWSFDPAYNCHVVGNTLFEMGGEKYVVAMLQYKGGKNQVSHFAIVRMSDEEKVAIWKADAAESEIIAQTAGANWITPVVVDANTTELYQYFPAENAGEAWIAKYTFKKKGSSVDGIDAAPKAKVIAGQGMITVEGDASDIAVYTMSGALVSAGERSVDCAAGLYIVKVDGTATKVLVK